MVRVHRNRQVPFAASPGNPGPEDKWHLPARAVSLTGRLFFFAFPRLAVQAFVAPVVSSPRPSISDFAAVGPRLLSMPLFGSSHNLTISA